MWVRSQDDLRSLPFARRIEPVADQVEQHTSHVLRCQCDGRNALTKFTLQRHGEALILRTRAVIREVQRLIGQGIKVDLAPLTRTSA